MRMQLGSLKIASPVFTHGGRIPQEYSVEGNGYSPELIFTGVPAAAEELVLICHDPDAPMTYGFTHWVLYNIPVDTGGLGENCGDVYTGGVNELGNSGWVPPAPPPGHGEHFYYFQLFALDKKLGLEPGLSRAALLEKIDEHILEQARIVGIYSRA
ncbi:MAG: YbhB/YbcL family Raf kinase inhibitor-like protein [Firmicutes bacterium]|nr:YbhB/YbcL family Raf kinase inhibitor-like protein [Bacillota bacterium]